MKTVQDYDREQELPDLTESDPTGLALAPKCDFELLESQLDAEYDEAPRYQPPKHLPGTSVNVQLRRSAHSLDRTV